MAINGVGISAEDIYYTHLNTFYRKIIMLNLDMDLVTKRPFGHYYWYSNITWRGDLAITVGGVGFYPLVSDYDVWI